MEYLQARTSAARSTETAAALAAQVRGTARKRVGAGNSVRLLTCGFAATSIWPRGSCCVLRLRDVLSDPGAAGVTRSARSPQRRRDPGATQASRGASPPGAAPAAHRSGSRRARRPEPIHLPRAMVVQRLAKLRGRSSSGRQNRLAITTFKTSSGSSVAGVSDTSDAMTSAGQLTDISVMYHSPNPFVLGVSSVHATPVVSHQGLFRHV